MTEQPTDVASIPMVDCEGIAAELRRWLGGGVERMASVVGVITTRLVTANEIQPGDRVLYAGVHSTVHVQTRLDYGDTIEIVGRDRTTPTGLATVLLGRGELVTVYRAERTEPVEGEAT